MIGVGTLAQMSGIVTSPNGQKGDKVTEIKKTGAWRSALATNIYLQIGLLIVASIILYQLDRRCCVCMLCVALPYIWHSRRQRKRRLKELKKRQLEQFKKEEVNELDLPAFDDPLRWCFVPSTGSFRANMSRAVKSENEFAKLRFLVLHKPTHDPEREASNDYPYSWHFAGRKRLWEVRVQVQFKQVNQKTIYFGLEFLPSEKGAKLSWTAVKIKDVMLQAIRRQIGNEFHHSSGEDPSTTEGEAEVPVIALPLWALDQFHVAEPGEEPEIWSDLNGVGVRRTDVGVKKYAKAMKELQENLSTDKVYTFCFWGVAQFLDVMNWEMCGILPGHRIPANKLCGKPPVYVVAYQLADSPEGEKRHLVSRKSYYFKVALWSKNVPPSKEMLEELTCNMPDAGSTSNGSSVSKLSKRSSSRMFRGLRRAVSAIC